MHLEITTQTPCSNRCPYCPQEVLEKAYQGEKVLSLDNFKRFMLKVPNKVDIHFSGFCEPFLNQATPDMIEFVYNRGHKLHIYTTLAGLTEENSKRLERIKFEYVRVHDIGKKTVACKWAYNKSPVVNIVSRAGNLKPVKEKVARACSRCQSFTQNVMLPNGDIYLCCQDYGLKHKLGNLGETNFLNLNRDKIYSLCRKCEYAI